MYYQFIFRSFVRIGHSWKESYKVNFIFAVRILRCISMKYSALSDEEFQLHWHIEELNTCLNRRLIVILSWLPFQSCKFLIRPSVEPCGRRSKKRAFGDEPIVFLPRRRFRFFFFFFSFFSAKAETFSLSLAFLGKKRWFQRGISWRVIVVVGGLPSSVACETPRVIHGLSTLVTGIRPWSSFPDGSTTVTRARALKDPGARDFAFANTV